MGVDEHDLRALPGVHRDGVVSGIFCRFFRRRALRDERRVAGHGARAAAADVPQLVPAAISIRLRDVPMREGGSMTTPPLSSATEAFETSVARFANDVQ